MGICKHIIGYRIFVRIEVDILPAELIRSLRNHMCASKADGGTHILRILHTLEIGILSVESRIDRHDIVIRLERTLVGIAGIDIHARYRHDFQTCPQGMYIQLACLVGEIILQSQHAVVTALEGSRCTQMEGHMEFLHVGSQIGRRTISY